MIKNPWWTVVAIVVVALIGIGLQAAYCPHMPERVATHFGPSGQPDGWMSRTSAVVFQAALQIGLPSLFVWIAWAIPRFPNSMINVPHREFWLAPERRAATLQRMSGMLLHIALANSIFVTVIGHLVYDANRRGGPLSMGPFVTALVVFIGFVLGIAGYSVWTLKLPRAARGD
ncbi:MAG: DUF1648 domain-containing protein [Pirellula sp.]